MKLRNEKDDAVEAFRRKCGEEEMEEICREGQKITLK